MFLDALNNMCGSWTYSGMSEPRRVVRLWREVLEGRGNNPGGTKLTVCVQAGIVW